MHACLQRIGPLRKLYLENEDLSVDIVTTFIHVLVLTEIDVAYTPLV